MGTDGRGGRGGRGLNVFICFYIEKRKKNKYDQPGIDPCHPYHPDMRIDAYIERK